MGKILALCANELKPICVFIMSENYNVLMASTFGKVVKGVSPYSNALFSSIEKKTGVHIYQLNFSKMYPEFLHPSEQPRSEPGPRGVSYLKPWTWKVDSNKSADILHVQYWSFVQLPIVSCLVSDALRKNIKVVMTVHNPRAHEKTWFVEYLENRILNKVCAIVVHTRKGAELLEQRQIMKDKITVIPHGVFEEPNFRDETTTNDYFEQVNLEPAYRYVLFFGNVRPYKGLQNLLDAWQMLQNWEKLKDVKLLVVGRLWEGQGVFGALAGWILGFKRFAGSVKKQIEEGTPKNVCYRIGFCSDDDMLAYFKVSDLGVFPYTAFSGQSGAVSMAAGSGLPVVVSDQGGLSELAIDSSFVFHAGNVEHLAYTIEEKLKCDRGKLSNSQRQVCFKYSWENSAELHTRLYRKILE